MMDFHEARSEVARQKMVRYAREAEIARQFPHATSLWTWVGLATLKFTRRLEAWLTRHLPLDGAPALKAVTSPQEKEATR